MIQCQWGIFRIMTSKRNIIIPKESSRGIYIRPSLNNTPSSPLSGHGIKIKAPSGGKSDDKLPAGIIDYYSFSPLVIDVDFKMGGLSGGNVSMNSHNLPQQDWDYKNGDASSGNGL